MKHTRIHINKKARSLFLLLGMLAVTVWGYGKDSGTLSTDHVTPFDLAFNNLRNEGDPSSKNKYQGFVHEKEEIIYLAPGDRVMVELCGTGGAQIDDYVRWYVDPNATYLKDIKEYMDVYSPVNKILGNKGEDAMLSPKKDSKSGYDTQSRYLYYKEEDKDEFVTGYLHHTGSSNPQLRYVYLKAPKKFESDEYVIYCDLGKTLKWNEHLHDELTAGTYIANRINLRRKYIIRPAKKMADAIQKYNKGEDLGEEASFFGKYEIHAPIEANYITLRLPHALSNYYTGSGTALKKPEYLYWSFYKNGEETPVYQVKTEYENGYTDGGGVTSEWKQWDGLIKLGSHNVHLRAHVLDVAMNMLKIEDKTTRQTYTVVAALGDENKADTEKEIVTITLNLEPNYKALTEKDFTTANNLYQFRSEEILEKYYKSLGNISFNNNEQGKGEGYNGEKIVDNQRNCILEKSTPLTNKNNMGVVPLQQNYSNYGFGALANNNTNNNDINLSVSGSYQPGRGEYAFMRSIGVDGINGNGQSLKDEVMVDNNGPWYHFTPSEDDTWGRSPFYVYDRRYQVLKEHGFFMYVDADESPDLITLLPIDNADITLCNETQIVVTAWVCNLNRSSSTKKRLISVSEIKETPHQVDGKIEDGEGSIQYPKVAGTDLGFTFKALNQDTNQEEIIYKYYSGEIENNVRTADPNDAQYNNNKGAIPAEWQQIYMSFTIPSKNYTNYKLEVASNCLHTDGGDFAIDDIRVYMSQPQVNSVQENLCDETSSLLIKANYDLLLNNIGLNEQKMNLSESEKIPTWSQQSWELTADGDHGGDPRHYHMYYTVAQKYTPTEQDNKTDNGFISADQKGWVVKYGEDYWRYLFLNYNNEDNYAPNGAEDAFGTAIISVNKWDIPTFEEVEKVKKEMEDRKLQLEDTEIAKKLRTHELAWLDTENDQYVVLGKLAIDYGILTAGHEYYIQLFPHFMTGVERPMPSDKCAISNKFKVEKSHTIYVKADVTGDGKELDGTTIVPDDAFLSSDLKILDLSERTTDGDDGIPTVGKWITIKDMYFDWYLGEKDETIMDALSMFRKYYQSEIEIDQINGTEDFTNVMAQSIKDAITAGKLYLFQNQLSLKDIDENVDYSTITLFPIDLATAINTVGVTTDPAGWRPEEGKVYQYCDGPFQFSVRTGDLIPASVNSIIRIGSWQLEELKNDNQKYLRIPVFNAVGKLEAAINTDVVLAAIDEKIVKSTSNPVVAKLKTLVVNAENKVDDADNITDDKISKLDPTSNYLDLVFTGDGVNQKVFEEGHTYTVKFHYQKVGASGTKANDKTAELHIKVVPKYLTWNGSVSSDWNDDANWERSNRTDDLYFDNGGPQPDFKKAFAPMKGSYVTMKKMDEGTATVLGPLGDKNGLGLGQEFVLNLEDNDIQYEVVAEDPYVNDESTNRSTDIWHASDPNDGNRYYAIYYYGNWCKEIYFKPEAMLQYQQHLTYDKAWVDFELTPERWYLLSSPLQDVVSGDMYLPATSGKLFGRQETEAFKDIEYDYQNKGNDRFNPAVYQRTWNGAATNYGFDMNKSDLIIQGDWSNLHNDVYKSYIPGTGFSVGVQLRSGEIQEPNTKTLFRLPKADEKYQLQSSENTGSYTEVTLPDDIKELQRSNKLVEIKGDKVEITIPTSITRQTTNEDYHLIGNPFMAALDMSEFLKENTDKIENVIRLFTEEGEKVYTVTEDGTTLSNTPEQIFTIAPLQGFMVKKTGTDEATITFNTSMITVEEGSATLRSLLADAEPKAAFPQLFITAERDGQQSSAMVACREEASVGYRDREDIVMITDPDRMEVPTVYTLAGNRAVIIHSTPDMHNVPLGIYSDSKDPVVVRFSGVEAFSVPVYLYDAETQTSTLIASSNQELTLPGNTHGRYSLRSDYVPTDNDVVKAKGAISIYSMMPGQVIVSSIDPLTRILVYNLSGQLVTSRSNLNTPTAYIDGLLPGQIYIVKAETASQVQTEKVEVR